MARICVIRQGRFSIDSRVRRATDTLLAADHEVDVISLAFPGEPRFERDGRLTVHRIKISQRRGGIGRYIFEYGAFLFAASTLAARLAFGRRYDLVQVHSLPDTLVFAALVPRLLGARVLLDLHECMPEYFATKFRKSLSSRVVRLIALAEQLSIRFADYVLTCTEPMRETFISRGAAPQKIRVVLNSADETLFNPTGYASRQRSEDGFVLISHGSLEEIYGIDVIVKAVALLKDEIPQIRLEILGGGSRAAAIRSLVRDLRLEGHVSMSEGWMPTEAMPARLAAADVGIVAIRRNAFCNLTHSNKMFEFIAMRKPVVIVRTRAVDAYFGDECFLKIASDDPGDLARAVRELYAHRALGERLVRRASVANEPNRWSNQRVIYGDAVSRLLKGERPAPAVSEQTPATPELTK